ncbi:MAG TPA: response regulator [Solirubrobacteraceae bacterium]|jgi:CheY-like chemotaxis protein|nr:response regulator [Solirubrobacteraceae bacterium]
MIHNSLFGGTLARVLVVDDELALRAVMRRALERSGHEVREACDGAVAWQKIRSQPPDVVVTDVTMPVMSGTQLAKLLRTEPSTAPIPIVVVSAHIPHDTPANVRVAKPFHAEEIVEAVNGLLR